MVPGDGNAESQSRIQHQQCNKLYIVLTNSVRGSEGKGPTSSNQGKLLGRTIMFGSLKVPNVTC